MKMDLLIKKLLPKLSKVVFAKHRFLFSVPKV